MMMIEELFTADIKMKSFRFRIFLLSTENYILYTHSVPFLLKLLYLYYCVSSELYPV